MAFLAIDSRQYLALREASSQRFIQRVFDFLETVAGRPRSEQSAWAGYLASAEALGLQSERELILFVYLCALARRDVASSDRRLARELRQLRSARSRLSLLERRIGAHEPDQSKP